MKKIFLLSILLLTGCMKVGPNFEPPCVPMQDSWLEEVSALEPEGLWWEKLDDQNLNTLIETALSQNLSLVQASWRIKQARYDLGIAIGFLFPQQQQAEGGISRIERSNNSANSAFGDINYTDFNLGLSVAWELDFWGRFRRGVEGAQDQLFATYANYEDVEVLLIAEVASVYTALRTTENRILILENNVKIQKRSLDIVHARWQAGLVTELDVQQAKTLLEATRARLPDLEREKIAALNGLAVLLGVTPEDLFCYIEKSAVIPKAPSIIDAGLPCALVMRRPDLRRALNEVAAQSATIGVAYSDLFPHLFIGGTVGVESTSGAKFTRSGGGGNLFSGNSFTYMLGPTFAWQIWNYGRLENRVRSEYAQFYQLIAGYQDSVLKAYQDVENSLALYTQSKKQEKSLALSVDAAKRASDLANFQYVEGIQDYTRVLSTLEALLTQQEALSLSQGGVTQGFISTYRALGVGSKTAKQPSDERCCRDATNSPSLFDTCTQHLRSTP